jgi:hypothetical protein
MIFRFCRIGLFAPLSNDTNRFRRFDVEEYNGPRSGSRREHEPLAAGHSKATEPLCPVWRVRQISCAPLLSLLAVGVRSNAPVRP